LFQSAGVLSLRIATEYLHGLVNLGYANASCLEVADKDNTEVGNNRGLPFGGIVCSIQWSSLCFALDIMMDTDYIW
jgi:hypothetical protein